MRQWYLRMLPIGILVGLALSRLPWGEPGRLHGIGLPVPVVVWDKGIDYVGFAGYVLNPLLACAGLCLGVGVVSGVLAIVRRVRNL